MPTTALQQLIDRVSQLSRERSGAGTHSARQRHIVATHLEERLLFSAVPVALATLSTTDNISAFDAVHGDADSLLTSLDGGRLVDGWGSHGDELGAPLHLLDGAAFDVSMPRKDDASSVIHRTYQGYEELLGQSAEDGDQWSFALESAAEKCATESADATDSAKQLVFIGGDVDGYEQLVEALRDNRGASQVEVHVLASDQDGVDQISKVLSEHSNVAALHILTHGGEGRVLLGDVQLSLASLSRFEEQIAGWSEHLAVGSDVLIYGCDVAATDDGRALTEQLSQLTGADVAASDDLTGHNSVGGDWDLEFTVGDVGTSVVVGLGQQQSWIVSLATIDVTTDQDVSDGDVSSIGALLADKGADNKVSLREAIEAVNNTGGGTHTIAFNISGGGVHTIELNSVLPEIATSVIIDGYTQGLTQENTLNVGTDAQLLIQLDGGNLGNNDHGLVISGDNVTIRGLIIGDFGGAGIYVHDADNAVVEGNFIGVNATGTSKDGNDYGVLLERATNAAIGGTTNAARNVISGNKYGVIVADMSWGNVVEGNLIGTSASGSSDLGNDNDGINVRDGAHDNTIGGTVAGAGNVISGTGILLVGDGVDIEATAGTGNRIQGNLIGLNANGTAGMYNAGRGISVEASGTLIGGTTAAARNVVSRNGGVGIQIANTDNITVIGNYVGSDISGNIDEGNLLGIYVDNSHDITIGGSTAAERNVVVGNTIRGVHITGSDSYNVTVAGNYIGVGADGSTDVGNSSSGIRLANGAHDITIGGATAAEGNVIANNGSDGITIDSDVGANFSLRNNTYTNNSGLGIDLGASGVTNNSNSDNWQDFPVLLGVHTSGSQTRFVGTVTGAASETVTVYFYLSASTDPSGYGEGDELVGSTDVVLNAFGTGTFSTTFAVDGSGRFASAIAHGTSGTSEFSSSAPIAANAPVVSLDDDGSSGATPGNYRASFSIGGAAVSIVDIDASITDSDSTHLGSLTVTITNLMDAGSEFLSATSSHPSINISYDAGAGVLTATGNASVAQYLTTLATLTYQNTSGSPDTIDRIITVVANDGTNSGSPALATVTFDANAAPTVTGPLTATDNEDGGTLSIDLLDGASDVDGDTLTPIGVTLTSGDDRGVSITGATVDVDLAQYGSLSVGESEVIVYDYTISDGNGGNVAQTLTITIEGRNDNPAVTGAVTATRHENAAVFNVDLLAGANDGDSSDTLNVVGLTLVSGDDSGVTIVGNSLQVDPTQYNYLSVGQFEEIQYSYDVSDGNGGSVAQTATIRINGRNDAPVVTASISATSNEDAVGFTVNLLTNATDPDQADTLSVAGLTLTGGDDRGITVVGNALVVDPSLYNDLAVGQAEVVTHSYTISDGHGGTVSQTATITIAGRNDGPSVSGTVASTTNEDAATFSVDLLSGASDPDTADTLSVAGLTLTGGDDRGITVAGNALVVDPSLYNDLAVGQTEVVTYSYTISDGHGGTVSQTATVTIAGRNDGPSISGTVTATTNEDAATFSVDLLSGASDPDIADTLSVTGLTLTGGDDRGITVAGNALVVDPSLYNDLAVGQTEVVTYDYTISDGHGGTVSQTATITIAGRNDDPSISGTVASTTNEDAATFSVDLLSGASDPDTADTLSVTGLTLTGGDDRGIGIAGNTLVVDPSLYNDLAVGQTEVVTYSYTISDGHGGTVSQTATIDIEGRNDSPIVTGPVTRSRVEGAAPFAVDLLAGASDPDSGDTLVVNGLTHTSGNAIGVVVVGATTLTVDPGQYEYLAAGENEVIRYAYTISDGHGGTVAQTATITIVGSNDAPTISSAVTATRSENAPDFVVDLLAGATDMDTNDVLSVAGIVLTGGNDAGITVVGNTLLVAPAQYDYLGMGQSEVILYSYSISDGHGGTVAQTATITINGASDVTGNAGGPYNVAEEGAVTMTATGTSSAVGGIISYEWDLNYDGITFNVDATGQSTIFSAAGIDGTSTRAVAVRITDSVGDVVIVDTTVTIANAAPHAVDDVFAGWEDTTITTGNVLINDSDVSSLDSLDIAGVDTTSTRGTVVNNGDGTFSYTPPANYAGWDAFVYIVSDGDGGTDYGQVKIQVQGVNDAPTMSDVSFDILIGNTLVTNAPGLLSSAKDIDGNTMTAILVSGPSHGTVHVNANGSFTYVADDGFSGTDSFAVAANDGTVDSNIATVTINTNSLAGPLITATTNPSSVDDPAPESPSTSDASSPETTTTPLTPTVPSGGAGTDTSTAAAPRRTATPSTSGGADDSSGIDERNIPSFTDVVAAVDGTSASGFVGILSGDGINGTASDSSGVARTREILVATASMTLPSFTMTNWETSLVGVSLVRDMDLVREGVKRDLLISEVEVGTVAATGITVGYVIWTLRGGLLVASLLSSMPVWHSMDPLPILDHLAGPSGGDDEDDEGDSLLSWIDHNNSQDDAALDEVTEALGTG